MVPMADVGRIPLSGVAGDRYRRVAGTIGAARASLALPMAYRSRPRRRPRTALRNSELCQSSIDQTGTAGWPTSSYWLLVKPAADRADHRDRA